MVTTEVLKMNNELLNKLDKESVIFNDYKFLAKYLEGYTVIFKCPEKKIEITNSFRSVELLRTDDYYYTCICDKELTSKQDSELFKLSKILDKLKMIFDFELIKKDSILKNWCSATAVDTKINKDDKHVHYLYKLKFKPELNNVEPETPDVIKILNTLKMVNYTLQRELSVKSREALNLDGVVLDMENILAEIKAEKDKELKQTKGFKHE